MELERFLPFEFRARHSRESFPSNTVLDIAKKDREPFRGSRISCSLSSELLGSSDRENLEDLISHHGRNPNGGRGSLRKTCGSIAGLRHVTPVVIALDTIQNNVGGAQKSYERIDLTIG